MTLGGVSVQHQSRGQPSCPAAASTITRRDCGPWWRRAINRLSDHQPPVFSAEGGLKFQTAFDSGELGFCVLAG